MRLRFHWLVYAFILSLPLYAFPLLNFQTRVFRWDWLITLLLVGLVILSILLSYRFKVPRSMIIIWLVLFNIWVALSVFSPFLSMDSFRMTEFTTTFVQYVFMSALFVTVASLKVDKRHLERVLKLYVLISVTVGALGVLQFIGVNLFNLDLYFDLPSAKYASARSGYESRLGGIQRATSIFIEPRHFGAFLLPAFVLMLVNALHGYRLQFLNTKALPQLFALLLLTGILVSLALSAYLGLAIALIGLPLLVSSKRRRVLTGFATVLLVLIVLIAGFEKTTGVSVSSYAQERLWPSSYSFDKLLDFDTSLGGPARYLRGSYVAISLAVSNPLAGIGLNQTGFVVEEDVVILPPFELLAAVGLLGFACFAMFVLTLGRRIFALRRHVDQEWTFILDGGLVLLLACLVNSLFASKFNYVSPWFWWGVIFAGWAYFVAVRQERYESENRNP